MRIGGVLMVLAGLLLAGGGARLAYIETKQGFEIDGVEIKARMDFGAAAIDYRGLQKNAGA